MCPEGLKTLVGRQAKASTLIGATTGRMATENVACQL